MTNIVKNNDKEKWVYSGFGITFDGACSWNFGNDFAKNVVIFVADNSSSSHANSCKNNFYSLVKAQLMVLMEASVHRRKIFVLILVKQTQNVAWVCIIMVVIFTCLLMENNRLRLESIIKILTFQLNIFF